MSRLFRQESVERLSSPERLDQLMYVADAKSWIPLSALGGLALVALVWSIFGKIPVTVAGQGIIVFPRRVVPLQSVGTGQIAALNIKVGDVVEKGQIVATLSQPDLVKQLQLEKQQLRELEGQDQSSTQLQNRQSDLQVESIQQQRSSLRKNISEVNALIPTLREKGVIAIRLQRQALEERLIQLNNLSPALEDRLKTRQNLLDRGIITGDQVLQARQEYLQNLSTIADLRAQLKQLDSQEADAERQYLQNLNSIDDFESKLKDLNSQEARLRQQIQDSSFGRANQIQQVRSRISRLEQQIKDSSNVKSEYEGVVLEMTATSGQIVNSGTRLASIGLPDPSKRLITVAYFPDQSGRQVSTGMQVQITPAQVKREQFGGILGKVKTISPYIPTIQGVTTLIGSEEATKALLPNGSPQVEVFIELEEDSTNRSGYKWSSSKGPNINLDSGTLSTVQVLVEERAPITYILPFLRSTTGIY
ncbi:NHLP bacteriocin system secretion protein [Pseudanabaena sp. FACHB-1998]|uniref:NHLP bacteriocin system secretion protein n=1 Tax=Pseudanabaena sp. FACHB-1998 TaxID=2692858 RepID=UPI001680A440|nr:NHLP bacteriocin system secretion protein [Pseudanabaena sp. FACHB-1998]MBD2179209.1 NHLP bacteriocin system secretion protein [Pseudanabaena sp. FACHB-1998]